MKNRIMSIVKIPKVSIPVMLLYLIINSLFIVKYTSRIGLNPHSILLVYITLLVLVYITFFFIKERISIRFLRNAFWIVFLINCAGIIYFLITLDPYKLRIDRWSAIHNFIQNLFEGKYPYAAKTHCGGYGSPFPVWHIFHIPFYIMGNVGLGMLFSIIITPFILYKYFKSYLNIFIFMLLLLLSPGFWYEVAVRSDLIYNFIICLLLIVYIYKKRYSIQSHPVAIGIIGGLMLSTRFSIIIPFSIFLLPYFFNSDLKKKINFAITALAVFIATFLPFALWNFNTLFFFKYNPFVLQTRQGSLFEVIIITLLGTYLSIQWKNKLVLCTAYISVCLFCLVSITFTHAILSGAYKINLIESAYDITYFNMSLPFIIFAISGSFIVNPHKAND